METQEKLTFLRELFHCAYSIASWIYDEDGKLLNTDSEKPEISQLFERSGCLEDALNWEDPTPLCLGETLGMLWGVVFEQSDPRHLHVIGPVLNAEISQKAIEESVRGLVRRPENRAAFAELLSALPIVPLPMFQHYILMLHYCLNDQRLKVSDIHYQKQNKTSPHSAEKDVPRDRYVTYQAERQLLYHVREGDLNYQAAQERASSLSTGVRVQTDRPIKQAIISTTTFASLCTRAAIEGGLSPDTAYTVGDTYIQAMTACKSISELAAINHAMYEDFIQRVHRSRMNNALSKPIAACCEYIQLHPEEELSLSLLAKRAGYTAYYLSRKFKAEVGESIGDYIDIVRIERAKMLLEMTQLPIAEIAAGLQYCSSTHFSNTFRRIAGKLPREFRKASQLK